MRSGLDAYCSRHNTVYRRFGHPHAGPIKSIHYRSYRKEVSDLFNVNSNHPGLIHALDYITRWMQQAAAPEASHKWAAEVSRVGRHGVSPTEVLIEVCSFWCWLEANPRALPDTRAEDFALSRAVMALAPRPRRITREAANKGSSGYQLRPRFSALDSIGSHLRQVLAFFLVSVSEAVATKEARAAETLAQLRAPLASPTAAYLQEAAAKQSTTGEALPFTTTPAP